MGAQRNFLEKKVNNKSERHGEKSIEEVTVENPTNGKSIRCEFKPIKESKNEEKGIVQLSEKIKLTLAIQKGTRVLVKPIIKNQNDLTTNTAEEDSTESKPEAKTHSHSEIYVQNSQANQFMVENLKRIGNFLGNSDIVNIDRAAIASWKEQFGDKDIKEVSLEETRTGKKIRCKFQPIKDAKLEGKGILQIPEKIQQALQTKKGALVIVKPIVEEEEP